MSTIANLVIKLGLKDDATPGVERAGSKMGSALSSVGKSAAILGGTAALGGLFETMKIGFGEWKDSTKIAAQTGAVLKSTGGAAKVTAAHVSDLAGSILRKTGIDDEAVQSGENMLLTFTNVRNEVGRGNDIFDQATHTLADMSVKFGTDMPTAAVQLGKALNDPLKGMTALQREGVTFTAAQKDQVAAMVKAGNTMGAQKIILGELNTEFGGTAEAVGGTLPGELNILKESFANLAGALVTNLMPTMQQAVGWLDDNWTQLSAILTGVFAGIGYAIKDVVIPAIGDLINVGKSLYSFFESNKTVILTVIGVLGSAAIAIKAVMVVTKAWTALQLLLDAALDANPIGILVVALAALAGGLVMAYERSATFRAIVNQAWADVKSAGTAMWTALKPVFADFKATMATLAQWTKDHWGQIKADITEAVTVVKNVIGAGVAAAKAFWAEFGTALTSIAKTAFGAVEKVTKDLLSIVGSVFSAIDDLVHGRWAQLWSNLKNIVSKALDAIKTVLEAEVKIVLTEAEAIGKAIVDGVVSGVSSLEGAIKSKVEGALRGALSGLNPFSPVEHGGQMYIGEPLVTGAVTGLGGLMGALSTAITAHLRAAAQNAAIAAEVKVAGQTIGMAQAQQIAAGFTAAQPTLVQQIKTGLTEAINNARQAVTDARGTFASDFSSLASSALSAFDAKWASWQPPATTLLGKMQLQDQVASAKQAIQSALSQLTGDRSAATAAAQAVSSAAPNDGESAADFQTRLQGLRDQATQAQAQVVSDTAALSAARRAQTEQNLQLEAAQQTTAHAAKIAKTRDDLAEELLVLQKELAKHPDEYDKAQKKVMAVLGSYNVPLYQAGQKFATELAGGLMDQVGEVEKAAKAVADAVAKYLVTHSPAEKGPLSEASPYDLGARIGTGFHQGLADNLYDGAGLGVPLGGPGAPSLSSAAANLQGGGGDDDGDAIIMVDGETFGRIARKFLTRKGARNGGLTLGTA